MTAILVFIMFVSFIVVDGFSNRQAAKNELQTAFRAENGAGRVRSTAASPVVSDATGQDVDDHSFQVRAGHDRRRGDRREQRDQSAA